MSRYDNFYVAQLGDVSIAQHTQKNGRASLESKGKPEELLFSNTVLLPSGAGLKARSIEIDGVVYAAHGRSRTQMANHLESLIDRNIDVIAAEMLQGGDDDGGVGNGYYPVVHSALLWLHSMGHVSDIEIKGKDSNVEFTAEVTIFGTWQALSPAEWFRIRRNESTPENYRKSAFEVDDINPLPDAKAFFQDRQPYSFHKRFYVDTGYHYDPTYFVALYDYHDNDIPQVRYATDWAVDTAKVHHVWVDKLRWSADPVSMYLFKNLTTATTLTIEVEHDDGDWSRTTTTTTITVSDISTAMTAAGFTLADTDILVVGHVTNGAFILRSGSVLLNVADLVTRDGGNYAGQIYRGTNVIKVRGGTFAQHHVFRRF